MVLGFVNDNPQQEYVVKADAAVTQANIRRLLALTLTTLLQVMRFKRSIYCYTLDITEAAANSNHMFRVVRSADDPENNDLTAAVGANQIVVAFNSASNLYQ